MHNMIYILFLNNPEDLIEKLNYIEQRVYIILKATLIVDTSINKQSTNVHAHNNNDKGLLLFSTNNHIEISLYSPML